MKNSITQHDYLYYLASLGSEGLSSAPQNQTHFQRMTTYCPCAIAMEVAQKEEPQPYPSSLLHHADGRRAVF